MSFFHMKNQFLFFFMGIMLNLSSSALSLNLKLHNCLYPCNGFYMGDSEGMALECEPNGLSIAGQYQVQDFQRDGTVQLFGTKGHKFLHCPGTKEQRDKLKILPRDGMGRDSQNSRRDGPGQPKSRTGCGTKWDRAEKDVVKKENNVLKQKMLF